MIQATIAAASEGHDAPPSSGAKTAIDPVCGMTVDPHATAHRAEHQGHPYYFCSAGCRSKFVADPQKYLGGKIQAQPVAEGTIYTCPMHPQIR
ncbi:MAG: P-type Cu+ transporter, partial [Alphaproteobacteria bacterium]|nr:P-type Cu+ transporter [Alphaproteobacteria bacterium]